MSFYCTVCEELLRTELVAANGHVEGEGVVTLEPTCEEEGVTSFYCTVCEKLLRTEPIAANGHVEGEGVVTLAPTCEEEGVLSFYCAVCEKLLRTEPIAALSHDWGPWTIVIKPDFGKPGWEERVCGRCEEIEGREIAPLADPEWKPATKDDAYGTKIASSAQHYYPGAGVEFWWGGQNMYGMQDSDGVLIIDESFFELHEKLTIIVKSSAEVQYVMAEITVPGTYRMAVPKWTDSKGKEHNINMVWIRFDNE